ncbi:MAG: hypothetical protein ACJAYF_002022, partial [Arenicella sp.]
MKINRLLAALKHAGIHIEVKSNKLLVQAPKNAMTAELSGSIKEHKELLVRLFGKVNSSSNKELDDDFGSYLARKRIASAKQKVSSWADELRNSQSSVHPVTYSQRGLWFIHQLEGGSAHYNMHWCVSFSESLDVKSVKQALKTITQRHHILRVNFFEEKGEVFLKFNSAREAYFLQSDFSHLEEAQWQDKLIEVVDAEKKISFDLQSDSLVRVHHVHFHAQRSFLLFTLHHIVADGWSIPLFRNEFSVAYQASLDRTECHLPELTIQFTDYIQWQNDYLSGSAIQTAKQYWRTRLADIPSLHSLPLDKPRPSEERFAGKSVMHRLDQDTTSKLLSLSRAEDVSQFILLQTCFSVLLSKFSGNSDIVMGTPHSGRSHTELDSLIGYFVNTLVLRCHVDSELSFVDLLQLNKQNVLADFSHQNLPLDVLIEDLKPPRSLAHSPLFQILFSMQNAGQTIKSEFSQASTDNQLRSSRETDCQTKYDLTLNVRLGEDHSSFEWSYKTSLFTAASINQMIQSFTSLLSDVIRLPGQPLSELSLLEASTQQALLARGDRRTSVPESAQTLVSLFEQQA